MAENDPDPDFAPLTALDATLWDYETTSASPRGHPLEPFRDAMRARRLPEARAVLAMRHGEKVSYAGLVICRQRPGTASGVTFMTLEDETGFVNVVLWRQVFERHRILAKTASFLGVNGKLQVEQGVVHVIADSLFEPRLARPPARPKSRDFH
ncbi:MAG: OB-fold nucleic acid binding domain-containing protein [Acidobacteriota bacterium]